MGSAYSPPSTPSRSWARARRRRRCGACCRRCSSAPRTGRPPSWSSGGSSAHVVTAGFVIAAGGWLRTAGPSRHGRLAVAGAGRVRRPRRRHRHRDVPAHRPGRQLGAGRKGGGGVLPCWRPAPSSAAPWAWPPSAPSEPPSTPARHAVGRARAPAQETRLRRVGRRRRTPRARGGALATAAREAFDRRHARRRDLRAAARRGGRGWRRRGCDTSGCARRCPRKTPNRLIESARPAFEDEPVQGERGARGGSPRARVNVRRGSLTGRRGPDLRRDLRPAPRRAPCRRRSARPAPAADRRARGDPHAGDVDAGLADDAADGADDAGRSS